MFFNRSFWPDVEATGQLLAELCQDLSQQHDVTVVAGRAYNMERFGSWLPVKREQWGRVQILRAYNPRLNKQSFALRVVNLLSYFCFSFLAGFFARRPEVVIVETDPPVLGLVALFFAKLYRAKLVFYLQDLYPDIGIALGKIRNPLLIRVLDWSTRLLLRRADAVVVLGEDMRERVLAKQCTPPDRVHIITNWVDTTQVRPLPAPNRFRQEHGLENRFVVMFSGNLGLSQGLERIIEAAAALAGEERIQFVFIGEGAAKGGLTKAVTERRLQNVRFFPYEPKGRLSESLGAADVHLVTLQRGLAGLIVPSKVYGIMAAGRPFIAGIEENSHMAGIVKKYECGLRVEPDSLEQLTAAIRWAASHPEPLSAMGSRGREAVEKYFSRRISSGYFFTLISGLGKISSVAD